jgi:hypothetical protein
VDERGFQFRTGVRSLRQEAKVGSKKSEVRISAYFENMKVEFRD